MFTLDQINDIHERLGSRKTLVDYLSALHDIGIIKQDSFVTDGHSEYYGKENDKVVSPPVHEKFPVANACNRQEFLKHLSLHEQGKINYIEMSKGLADSGIEKWAFDTHKMTISYYDLEGNEILVEKME